MNTKRAIRTVAAFSLFALVACQTTPTTPQTPTPTNRTAILEAIAANPPATGLLVLDVLPDSQAANAGIAPGDIIVSYADQPTASTDSLRASIRNAADNNQPAIPIKVRIRDRVIDLAVKPGTLGVRTVPVQQTKPLELRPPATRFDFDFTALKANPKDSWYAIYLDGQKIGYEHHVLSIENDRLTMVSDVAYDPGERGKPQSFHTTVTAASATPPTLITSRSDNRAAQFVSDTNALPIPNGKLALRTHLKSASDQTVDAKAPRDLMNDYLVVRLTPFMPRDKGACLHYTVLNTDTGRPGDPAAVICLGPDTIQLDGKDVQLTRYETRSLASTLRITWVDDAGQIYLNDYGSRMISVLSTREKALEGVNSDLLPRE